MPEFKRIPNHTREVGPPQGWDRERDGPCATLYVRDCIIGGIPYMVFALEFLPDEIERMQAGESVKFGIAGHQLPLMFTHIGKLFEDEN